MRKRSRAKDAGDKRAGPFVVMLAPMRANAENLRRAGLLLRAMSESASWRADVYVDARKAAKEKAIVATDAELAESESYMVDQGWLRVDPEADRGQGWYALTRHGLDESQRKVPAEPKPYKPHERTD
jgi:hypothetical protein